jgi:hypothetical protein
MAKNIIYGLCKIKQANQKEKLVNQRGGTLTLIKKTVPKVIVLSVV